ncbi:DNA polymerase IV [Dokdonia donghaensis]|uniref:DNA polymerase IV n=1 Tax=Dokdonia donghaensis DSW-1 TaxID=1300343 RepID=A0A0A2GT40_9FLAO|nr:DNA polymerase IV [Dokdonia donghaensis]ANH58997.1 DNA polymerase IV [Dokdonia donghaensis DSW-1]KGO06429.1 DNA polymerase IV [Dokdonia donghaensis DSW-1]
MQRTIIHFDLDTFFVSCERRLDSRLMGKPVIVGGTGDRGVVSAASYEARSYGVHSAMPIKAAKQLCPNGIYIRGNGGTYSKMSKEVTEILQEELPVLEKASVDEFYGDLTGMDRFHNAYKYSKELRQRVMRETGLPISFGMSPNKTVSKVATGEAKPNNEIKVDPGYEKTFLAPLSIKKIPSVGQKTFIQFCNLGVRTVDLVQQMPVEMMTAVFGKNGRIIWERCNGIDNSPIIAYHERKSISSERTYGQDTTDITKLHTTISAMAENLAFQLRRGNKLTSVVTVKVRYSDFQTYSKQIRIPYTAADHILIPKAMELFKNLYNRRMLIRLVGVRFSGLTEGHYQIDLFENTNKTVNLYKAMDALRDKYGDHTVRRANTIGDGSRTIGNQGNPFNGQPPILLAHRHQ